jgi:hypothetical protein
MVTLTLGVRVDPAGGSAPTGYCLCCLDTRAGSGAGQLFRHGVLGQAHPRLLWEDRYLTGPPRRDLGHCGNAISRIA